MSVEQLIARLQELAARHGNLVEVVIDAEAIRNYGSDDPIAEADFVRGKIELRPSGLP